MGGDVYKSIDKYFYNTNNNPWPKAATCVIMYQNWKYNVSKSNIRLIQN
ncbi:hypothetical protein RG47T_0361 [Mucilaginibacter polytrichastri]|uniref:Uncharacterized protein n=1 Tax=Mucilaginibacter polytrichastri TaxID=1302689 RepID=A0A1Q5ZT55_9SPHI|nr:hypothetical protein RG47T_0361 [Mucilaginibacter polytrichastri]